MSARTGTDAVPAGAPGGPLVGAIWAQTEDGVIGRSGVLPWSLPEDMAFFRRTTTGHPVIMGRRTWDSFPDRFRPLPGRTNIVLTSRPGEVLASAPPGGVLTAASYREAVGLALDSPGAEEIWVIGGAVVFEEALADAEHPVTEALVTVLELDTEGDTHAPALPGRWSTEPVVPPALSRTGLRYRIDRLRRPDRHAAADTVPPGAGAPVA